MWRSKCGIFAKLSLTLYRCHLPMHYDLQQWCQLHLFVLLNPTTRYYFHLINMGRMLHRVLPRISHPCLQYSLGNHSMCPKVQPNPRSKKIINSADPHNRSHDRSADTALLHNHSMLHPVSIDLDSQYCPLYKWRKECLNSPSVEE